MAPKAFNVPDIGNVIFKNAGTFKIAWTVHEVKELGAVYEYGGTALLGTRIIQVPVSMLV